jgi:nucleoside-diphosphate-sugar epimerase
MNCKLTACVTGASGMIGSKIVRRLIEKGYNVRGLSRSGVGCHPDATLFKGKLEDSALLRDFLADADMLFHCAAEMNDTSKMWKVNVDGTEQLWSLVKEFKIHYLCYLSSAGVVGNTKEKWVNEKTPCTPQNTYERTKLAAEKIVFKNSNGINTVILRPTNVIDENNLGFFETIKKQSFLSRLKVFVKGGECAHIIHAENVAAAAIYFISCPMSSPQCFFVSDDHDPNNTFAGLCAIYRSIEQDLSVEKSNQPMHLPIIIPYLLRMLLKGRRSRGDVRYSSEKLFSKGFKFPLDITESIRRILAFQKS